MATQAIVFDRSVSSLRELIDNLPADADRLVRVEVTRPLAGSPAMFSDLKSLFSVVFRADFNVSLELTFKDKAVVQLVRQVEFGNGVLYGFRNSDSRSELWGDPKQHGADLGATEAAIVYADLVSRMSRC